MFLVFWICLSFSIHILANPISQNSEEPIIADNADTVSINADSISFNAEPAEDSKDSNVQDTMIGTNLASSPGCTSDAATDEISDELTSGSGIFRRKETCPPDYDPKGAPVIEPKRQPDVNPPSSGTSSSDGPCKDPKLKEHLTCGGPVIGLMKFRSRFHEGPFFTWVLNCVSGKF